MSMRVIECNLCGETLAAGTDDELLDRLRVHTEGEHSAEQFDAERAAEQIANEAYDASDS